VLRDRSVTVAAAVKEDPQPWRGTPAQCSRCGKRHVAASGEVSGRRAATAAAGGGSALAAEGSRRTS
ncbi:MAG: hypothetical protein ACREDJ_09375, partial [Methylocella sp.]